MDTNYNVWFFRKMCVPTIIYALLYTFFLYKNLGGILISMLALATVIYSLYCIKTVGGVIKPMTIWYCAMLILTGISSGCTGNIAIQIFNLVWIFIFLVFMFVHSILDDQSWGLFKHLVSAGEAVIGSIACIYEPFIDTMDYVRNEKGSKKHGVLYIFLGAAIAIPLLGMLIVLLCCADAVFASVFEKLFADINFFTICGAVLLFVFALFSSYCGIKFLGRRSIDEKNFRSPDFPAAIAITVSALISVIYVFFCTIQIVYLFGKSCGLPSGYTYSQYAREGFFQLLFVCMFNVLLVLIGGSLFKQNKILNIFLIIISLCTYIMIASSAYRMGLYVGQYGLTTLRFFVFWALGVIALIMIGIIFSINRRNFPLFNYMMIIAGSCYLLLAFCRPDYLIAEYNITHMEETDYEYLMSLSTDAAPALAEDDVFMENEALASIYAHKISRINDESLRQANLSHLQAAASFEGQVSDAENTEYVLLYVYSPSETFEDGLQGVKNIRLGYKDEDSYENDDHYENDDPEQFTWTDAVEINDYAKEQRVFLAKIPKSDIKGKDGIEVGYSFSKKDVTEYSDTLNLVFYENDITELGLSYMDYEADYGNPQYQIFVK